LTDIHINLLLIMIAQPRLIQLLLVRTDEGRVAAVGADLDRSLFCRDSWQNDEAYPEAVGCAAAA
jgi:hypothetical protein